MKGIKPFETYWGNIDYRGYSSWLMAALILLFVVSCRDTNVHSTENVKAVSGHEKSVLPSSYEANSPGILSTKGLTEVWAQAKGTHLQRSTATDGFTSPLFGLATAPNGDILVADAGAGVLAKDGGMEIMLPGVSDMSPIGHSSMWALEGLSGDPEEDTGQGLYRASKGKTRLIVDLFDFEATNNPGGGIIDSNPFDVHSLGGRAALVADAGGNYLLRVSNKGDTEVLAVFPDELVSTENLKGLIECPNPSPLCELPAEMPAQAVPTSIAVGPDGYYYVGELKGFPAPTSASNIWRVAPDASGAVCGSSPDCAKVFDGGFTSIIDLAFDTEGTLHVAELDERSWFAVEELGPGAIAGGTINACDVNSLTCSEVATEIPILTAMTFGKNGTLWATQNALIPGAAEVVEIE